MCFQKNIDKSTDQYNLHCKGFCDGTQAYNYLDREAPSLKMLYGLFIEHSYPLQMHMPATVDPP